MLSSQHPIQPLQSQKKTWQKTQKNRAKQIHYGALLVFLGSYCKVMTALSYISLSKTGATTGLPVSRYDLCNVFFILLECCLRCQGLLLSLKSSKVNQHLDAKCSSAGPVPQRPEGPDRTKSDKLKSIHL